MPANNDIAQMTDAQINEEIADRLGVDRTINTKVNGELQLAIDSDWLPSGDGRPWMSYAWNGVRYYYDHLPEKPCRKRCSTEIWCWRDRAGRDYQADIEAHVAAYRKPPADYCNSWEAAIELGEDMLHRQLDREYGASLEDIAAKITDESTQQFRLSHIGPRQRAEAALKVLREAQGDAK